MYGVPKCNALVTCLRHKKRIVVKRWITSSQLLIASAWKLKGYLRHVPASGYWASWRKCDFTLVFNHGINLNELNAVISWQGLGAFELLSSHGRMKSSISKTNNMCSPCKKFIKIYGICRSRSTVLWDKCCSRQEITHLTWNRLLSKLCSVTYTCFFLARTSRSSIVLAAKITPYLSKAAGPANHWNICNLIVDMCSMKTRFKRILTLDLILRQPRGKVNGACRLWWNYGMSLYLWYSRSKRWGRTAYSNFADHKIFELRNAQRTISDGAMGFQSLLRCFDSLVLSCIESHPTNL